LAKIIVGCKAKSERTKAARNQKILSPIIVGTVCLLKALALIMREFDWTLLVSIHIFFIY